MRLAFGVSPRPLRTLLVAALILFSCQRVDAAPALDVLSYELAANQDVPELCFILSETVARRLDAPLESAIGVEPAIKLSAIPRNNRLCLSGFAFGAPYTVTLKAGLPGVSAVLSKDTQFRVEIPNRPPELSFADSGSDLLPRLGSEGLPIHSVNVPRIELQIFHITDRDLIFDPSRAPLTGEALAGFTPRRGERVWRGSISPKAEANRDAETVLPVASEIGALKPGLYVAVAWASDAAIERSPQPLPTQYFSVSDIGLIAYRTVDSLVVAARSLANAAGAEGVDVALVARNNRELARVRADGNGLARFDASLLQGPTGDQPAEIRAYGAAGDFTRLALEGRTSADSATQEATFFPDRVAYLLGDPVNLLILLRNAQGAQSPSPALTIRTRRPDGTTFDVATSRDQGDGSYEFAFTLPADGPPGSWRIEAESDGGGPLIGAADVSVETPSPSGLDVSVGTDAAVIDPAQPGVATVQAQDADDRAVANAPGELDIAVEAAANPFPAFPGFSFGLDDENRAPSRFDPVKFTTDGGGRSSISLKLGALPNVTRPLEVRLAAQMLDAGGRTTERVTIVPLANQPFFLGVKPMPGPSFTEGQPTRFDIIAVSPDGARQEKAAAGWEILRQDPAPSWLWDGNSFAYRTAFTDTHIVGGTVDIPIDSPASIAPVLPAGRYRIEVFDQSGESISSTGFTVGWAAPDRGDTSDTIEVSPAKRFFTPGEVLDVFVRPPYESDVLLIPVDSVVRDPVVQHIPAAGATLHIDAPRDLANTVHLLATAVAPPDPATPGLSRRAFGAAVVSADKAARGLDVKLTPPDKAAPQQTLSFLVSVDGAGQEPSFVRVVAEEDIADENEGADKAAATDLLGNPPAFPVTDDIYGKIITPSGLTNGALSLADPADTPSPVHDTASARPEPPRVSYQSGIVALDKTGKGTVSFPLGEFSGKLRVRAVAWSSTRSGQAETRVAVHYPVAVDLALPDRLRPDDRADLTLTLDNIDGPRGEYRVGLHAQGNISTPDEAQMTVNLAEHEKRTQQVSVQAHGPGAGSITLSVQGPGDIAFERHLNLTVDSGNTTVSRHAVFSLKPGATLPADALLLGSARNNGSLRLSLVASDGGTVDLKSLTPDLVADTQQSVEQIVAAGTACFTPGSTEAHGPADCLTPAIQRLMNRQGSDGGFSLWGGRYESDPWLTAFAVDFLTRAKSAGCTIPEPEFTFALDYLALRSAAVKLDSFLGLPEIARLAYGNKVLAANGRLTIFQLRYFADQLQGPLRTALSTGLTAAAFAALEDRKSAAGFFAQALAIPASDPAPVGFSSELRDQAMLTALMAESGALASPTLQSAMDKLLAVVANRRQFNVEEAAWMFRAGAALPISQGEIRLKVGDQAVQQQDPYQLTAELGDGMPPPLLKNLGEAPIQLLATVTSAPAVADAKDSNGVEIQRWLFDSTGKPLDPATLRQNDLILVILTGRSTGANHPLVIDPLPAGWTIEAAEIVEPTIRYPWLKDLTGAEHLVLDKGRYVAAPNLAGDRREFKLAYVARASVRGQFAMPGPMIQDMVLPVLAARGSTGRTKIDAAQ